LLPHTDFYLELFFNLQGVSSKLSDNHGPINDIFYFIEYGTLYNYADDNNLSYVNDNYEKLIDIKEECHVADSEKPSKDP
jgi:hypothetical protein